MEYTLISLLGYLLGCSNMAYYLAKMKHVDIRRKGSGNLGTSNATILLGWGAGIIVCLHDIGKSLLAVFLAKLLFPDVQYAGAAAGVACVLGHIFPFWLGFKGGKGFASYLGMAMALNWKMALAVIALVIVITLVFDYLALGTMATILVVPVWCGIETGDLIFALILCIGTVVIFLKHWENFGRMRNGTEIGLRSTAKGEHKIK